MYRKKILTTDVENLPHHICQTVDALLDSGDNYIVIYPNNDHGSDIIINELKRLEDHSRFRIFPSVRFEYFLTLLKNARYMVGNSSAGVREAPFYGLPSINLGTRQANRAKANSILNSVEDSQKILTKIKELKANIYTPEYEFGDGRSDELFIKELTNDQVWTVCRQKQFVDIG